MKIKISIILYIHGILFFSAYPIYSENLDKSAFIAHPEYRVTPGDLYQLDFSTVNGAHTMEIAVDAEYLADMGYLGEVDARNMTFLEFREVVYEICKKNYASSSLKLQFVSPGLFEVHVSGIIPQRYSTYIHSLTRLSDVLNEYCSYDSQYFNIYEGADEDESSSEADDSSGASEIYFLDYLTEKEISTRYVKVISRDGSEVVYDLLMGLRNDNPAENPFLRPMDNIVLYPHTDTVYVNGAVRKPGRFQILKNESIATLLEFYALGFKSDADYSQVYIERKNSLEQEGIYAQYIDKSRYGDYKVINGDILTVFTHKIDSFFIRFTGAVSVFGQEYENDERWNISGLVPCSRGETIVSFIRKLNFHPDDNADLDNAVLYNSNYTERFRFSIPELLHYSYTGPDPELMSGDRIVIPEKNETIFVSGGVNKPGSFTFLPGQPPEYYIQLAGGRNRDQNLFGQYQIFDLNGNRKNTHELDPGDVIDIKQNHPLYLLQKYDMVISLFSAVILGTVSFMELWGI